MILKPKHFYKKIEDIQIENLKKFDLIFLDLDNTLVNPETIEFKTSVLDWLNKIKNKDNFIILSNSKSILKRKKEIEEKTNLKIFLNKHKKPSSSLYRELDQKFNLKNKKIAIIGDNIFTDILFGNLNNFETFLVETKYPDNWFKTIVNNLFMKILRIK